MPKGLPKCIQTCFSVIFTKKFYAQCSMEGRVFEIFKIFFFKIPKTPKIVPKRIQTCFDCNLGQFFRKIFASFPWKVESSKIFKKKNSKIPKMPKSVPKCIQTCFSVIFTKKFYAQCSMEGRVFENFQIFFFKIPKTPQIIPKRIQTCFDCNLGQFFRKIFAQFSMEGRFFENFQKNQKNFKFPKMPKIVLKSIQTCFERVLGQTFRKIFAQFSMEGRVFENFQKNNFKIPKMPKSVPKCIQTCFSVIFTKKFYAQCSMEGRVFENFQKFFFSKFQKRPKSFPKESKRVLIVIWDNFFEKFLPSFPWKVESSKYFQKNQKSCKFPKMPKIVLKSIQTCFERVLGQTFRKIFAQFSMEGRVFENFQKK